MGTKTGFQALLALGLHPSGFPGAVLAAIVRGLTSPWAPAQCLSEIHEQLNGDTPETLEALTAAIQATEGIVRVNEAMVEQMVTRLACTIGDDNQARAFRKAALKVLAGDGYPEHAVKTSHVKALCKQLKGDAIEWQEAAMIARVLAQWRRPSASSALIDLVLRDSEIEPPTPAEMQARWAAAEALENLWLTDSDRTELRAELEAKAFEGCDAIQAARIRAAAALGPVSKPFAHRLLEKFTKAPELQSAILIALGRRGDSGALPIVLGATTSRTLAREATVALAQIMPCTQGEEDAIEKALWSLATDHFDPRVRSAAISAVENHRGWLGVRAIELCQMRLRNDVTRSVRLACIHALKRMQADAASETLLSVAFNDADSKVRTQATRALTDLPMKAQVRVSIGERLVAALQNRSLEDLPFAAMIRLLNSWAVVGAFDTLLSLTANHHTTLVRSAAIRGASKLPLRATEVAQTEAHLAAWSQDDIQEIRLAAAFAAGAVGSADSLQMLVSDPDPNVRMATLKGATGRPELLHNQSGLDCAGYLVTDPVPAVRAQAVLALSQLKTPDALEWMTRGLRDPYLARPLAEGYGRHGHAKGLDGLLELFDRVPNVGIRYAVLRSIGQLDLRGEDNRNLQERAIVLLSGILLHSKHRVLRSAAAYQFMKMSGWDLSQSQRHQLASTLKAAIDQETDRLVFRHLPVALGSLKQPETVPDLMTFLESSQPHVRAAAARGLCFHRNESTVRSILERMKREDPSAFVKQTLHNLTENRGAKNVRE